MKSLSSCLEYCNNFSRFHVPGHKGIVFPHDTTELDFTDNLYSSNGIIRDSENLISRIYGSGFSSFSTCGNTLCIQSILRLCFPRGGFVLVPRNVHKSTIYAMSVLNIEPVWVEVDCEQNVKCEDIEKCIEENKNIDGVFITSPDYFGRIADVSSIKKVCKNIPLLVDNAHGSHLIFFKKHPITLGADLSADSAHKTLPVLTGSAWFHVSKQYALDNSISFEDLKYSSEFFGSSSPSFLILESLEKCANWMKSCAQNEFNLLSCRVQKLKEKFSEIIDYNTDDPVRISFDTRKIGYTSKEFSQHLIKYSVQSEFNSGTKTVLIPSPFNSEKDWMRLYEALNDLSPKEEIKSQNIKFRNHVKVMSLRESTFSESERIPIDLCNGRISAQVIFRCPPGIAEFVPGELIQEEDIEILKSMNFNSIRVVRSK